MRRYSLLSALLLAFVFVFQSCRGPEGLPGPQGPEGPAGAELLPVVFNVSANFSESNQFRNSYNFSDDVETLESDVVLVYLAYDEVQVNGVATIVWRALPQVIPVPEINGFFQYNYDYTMYDVEFFMDGTVDLTTLDGSWTQNQLFRVVVLPADALARKAAVDLNDYQAVVNAYGIDETKIKTVSAK